MPPPNERGRPAKAASDVSTGIATGSIVADGPTSALDAATAARLVTRINLRLTTVADNFEQVVLLIEQAKAGNAHLVLGYRSWPEFVADKFGDQLTRLARLDRQPVLELLSGAGMSARGIEAATKIPKSTVSRDLSHRGTPADRVGGGHSDLHVPEDLHVPDLLVPEDLQVPDLLVADDLDLADSPMATATDEEFEQAISSARAEGDLSRENLEHKVVDITSRKVTGVDGKTYTRSTPAAPRRQNRRPLPDAYRDTSHTLLRNVESLSRLHQDDRFTANRDAVKGRSAADLAQAANGLLDLLDDLGVDRHQYCGVAR